MIEKLTRIDALRALSLANKAGLVITGYEKIKRALAKGHVKWLLHAMEASKNGSDKLDRYCLPTNDQEDQGWYDDDDNEQGWNDEEKLESDELLVPQKAKEKPSGPGILFALFTGDELSLALGRSNVIHIGLKRGETAKRFTFALQKSIAFDTQRRVEAEKTQACHETKK